MKPRSSIHDIAEGNEDANQRMLESVRTGYGTGARITCYLSPTDPTRAVLDPSSSEGDRTDLSLFIAFGLALFSMTLLGRSLVFAR